MSTPYPTFRQLAALCRAQSAGTSQPEMAAMLLVLASEYEEQAQAEEACRQGDRQAA
jgi:hypothetical protein